MKHGSDPKKDVPDLKDTLDYYEKKLFVELLEVPKGVRTEIPYLENATSEDLIRLVKPKYTVKDREPWVLGAGILQCAARVRRNQDRRGHPGKRGTVGALVGNEEIVFELPKNKYAWWALSRMTTQRTAARASGCGGTARHCQWPRTS